MLYFKYFFLKNVIQFQGLCIISFFNCYFHRTAQSDRSSSLCRRTDVLLDTFPTSDRTAERLGTSTPSGVDRLRFCRHSKSDESKAGESVRTPFGNLGIKLSPSLSKTESHASTSNSFISRLSFLSLHTHSSLWFYFSGEKCNKICYLSRIIFEFMLFICLFLFKNSFIKVSFI